MPIKKSFVPLEGLYHLGDKINRFVKKARVLPGCKVVSIGNITVGGTGKTPAAIYFSRLLKSEFSRMAVLSRGYGGSKSKEGALLSDGKSIFITAAESGDEPYLIAMNLNGVQVAVGRKRFEMGMKVLQGYQPELFILDDGFQHYALARDVDIVLVDATNPFGNGHLLPNGILREPVEALKRADIIITTKSDLVSTEELDDLVQKIKDISHHTQVFKAVHKAVSLTRLPYDYSKPGSQKSNGFNVMQKENIWAISAIGNHRAFEQQLKNLGAASVSSITFRDHHDYTEKDVEAILKRISPYDIVITTEKDWIKLSRFKPMFSKLKNFYFLAIEFSILNNEVLLKEGLKAKLLLGKKPGN